MAARKVRSLGKVAFNPVTVLRDKRDGREHSPETIEAFLHGFLQDQVADYQMSAWLMAAYLKGLSPAETVSLTKVMLDSGWTITERWNGAAKVDKHSTGGVGDKISLPLAPLVACFGLDVPMISGRGLGHTGGTLDKLESIPGYQINLTPARYRKAMKAVGTTIIGQSEKIAPADKRIYALRDVTGTVECIPLIVASILSKKLAAGLDALVLDVKCGQGAFMKTREDARALAEALVDVGTRFGPRVTALITDMNAPIGMTIGNALELREAIEVLAGGGPEDTRELTLALGAEMLVSGGVGRSTAAARKKLEKALDDGTALERFARMVELQGGDGSWIREPGNIPWAEQRVPVPSPSSGKVQGIDALELGLIAVDLGAGRKRKDDTVDHLVGIELTRRVGDPVQKHEPLAYLHVRKKAAGLIHVHRAQNAFTIGRRAAGSPAIVLETLRGKKPRLRRAS